MTITIDEQLVALMARAGRVDRIDREPVLERLTLLLLLPVCALAPIVAGSWAESHSQRALRQAAVDIRTADAFGLLSIDAVSGAEVRTLRVHDF